MIIDTQYVIVQLQRRKSEGQLTRVGKLTGFSLRSLQYIISGEKKGHMDTWERLQNFLKSTEGFSRLPKEIEGEETK